MATIRPLITADSPPATMQAKIRARNRTMTPAFRPGFAGLSCTCCRPIRTIGLCQTLVAG